MSSYLAIPTLASITRDSFQKDKNYQEIIFQRGKVLLDSELNEIQQIIHDRTQVIVETLGGLVEDTAFQVSEATVVTSSQNFAVIDGNIFVGGVQGYLGAITHYLSQAPLYAYEAQFAWNTTNTTPPALSTPGGARTDLVVLNLIAEEVSASVDASIMDPNLVAATAARKKIVQLVTVLEDFPIASIGSYLASFDYYNDSGCWRTPLAWVNREAGISIITAGMIDDIRLNYLGGGGFVRYDENGDVILSDNLVVLGIASIASISVNTISSPVVFASMVTINGSLSVLGSTTFIESETLLIEDNIIVVNANVTTAPTISGGMKVERGEETDATILWNEDDDRWEAGLEGSEEALVMIATASIDVANKGMAVKLNVMGDGFELGEVSSGGLSGDSPITSNIGIKDEIFLVPINAPAMIASVSLYNVAGSIVGTVDYRCTFYPIANVGTVTVGSTPWGICFDGRYIWVANSGGSNVSKIDSISNAVVETITVGSDPYHICFDGRYIWVANYSSENITKIDSVTNSIVGTVTVESETYPNALCFDGKYIWVTDGIVNNVIKIDAVTNAIVGTVIVESDSSGICFDGKYIWVPNSSDGNVTKIDAVTNAVVGTVTVGSSPTGACFDGRYIWVSNAGSKSLSKIDPDSNSVVATVTTGTTPRGLCFDGKNIWVANYGAVNATKIDTVTNAVVGTVTVGSTPWGICFDGRYIWVANSGGSNVSKIDGTANEKETFPCAISAAVYASASQASIYLPISNNSRVGGRKLYRAQYGKFYDYYLVQTIADNTTITVTDNFAQITLESLANPQSVSYDGTGFAPKMDTTSGGIWIGGRKVAQWY